MSLIHNRLAKILRLQRNYIKSVESIHNQYLNENVSHRTNHENEATTLRQLEQYNREYIEDLNSMKLSRCPYSDSRELNAKDTYQN